MIKMILKNHKISLVIWAFLIQFVTAPRFYSDGLDDAVATIIVSLIVSIPFFVHWYYAYKDNKGEKVVLGKQGKHISESQAEIEAFLSENTDNNLSSKDIYGALLKFESKLEYYSVLSELTYDDHSNILDKWTWKNARYMRKRMELIDIDKENITMTVEDLRKGLMNKGNPRFKKGIFRWKDWWDTGRCSGAGTEAFHSKGSEIMHVIKVTLVWVLIFTTAWFSLFENFNELSTSGQAEHQLALVIFSFFFCALVESFKTIPYWNTKRNHANPSWSSVNSSDHTTTDYDYNKRGQRVVVGYTTTTTIHSSQSETSPNWWYAPATHIVNGETRLCFGDVIKGENFELDEKINNKM
jgi:hypothetical protein